MIILRLYHPPWRLLRSVRTDFSEPNFASRLEKTYVKAPLLKWPLFVVYLCVVLLLSVLPGYAQERNGATPAALAAPPTVQRAAFDAFLFIDGIDGETDGGGGGGSTQHCYEDEELQMSICE